MSGRLTQESEDAVSIRSQALAAASALVLGAGLVAGASTPASATSGCTGTVTYSCVDAATGAKDYRNKTQWVGEVKGWGGTAATSWAKQEIWGDGFYYATAQTRATSWRISQYVGRSVRSGTNICSATTYTNGYRVIACIRITV